MTKGISGGVATFFLVGSLSAGIWFLTHREPNYPLPRSPYGLAASSQVRLSHYFGVSATRDDYEVSADTLHRWISQERPVVLIDVRQPGGAEGFRQGHIAGAHNIPLQWMGREIRARMQKTAILPFVSDTEGAYRVPITFFPLPRHVPIVVMCYDGNGGEMTPAVLRALGYDAYSLKDGVAMWNGALNVWPNWRTNSLLIDWPMVKSSKASGERLAAPSLGPYTLAPEDQTRVASLFFAMNHAYPVGYSFPWTIDPDTLSAMATSPSPPQIIDLRSSAEFERGHIPDSINIPFAELGANIRKINPEKPVVLVSQSLQRAAQANAMLRLIGYRAYVLKQGLADWNRTEDHIPVPRHYPIIQ